MRLSQKTRINDLLGRYPFLLDYLAGLSPKFSKLKSPLLRKTVGKVATLQQAAAFGDVPPAELLEKIRAEIKRVTAKDVEVEMEDGAAEPLGGEDARLEILKDIIRELHEGGDLEEQKRRFAALIKDVNPTEISEMEQALIAEGLPEEEVKRLCDVHVQVFKESLEGQTAPSAIPGHPLHTFMAENRALEDHLVRWKELLARVEAAEGGSGLSAVRSEVRAQLEKLTEFEKHYLRKENQLFPLLEAKGVSGPSKVMWAIHDDIRGMLRELAKLIGEEKAGDVVSLGQKAGEAMTDMIYKEEKILFPMSLDTLEEKDWARVRRGEEEIGYAWVTPGKEWQPEAGAGEAAPAEVAPGGRPLELDTGALTREQVDLLLKHLPLDVTFVDEHDTVRYYSGTPDRIFPRSPAVIGRRVQNCHPSGSVHIVNRILDSFRQGKQDVAEFWISLGGKFVHIRYFAVRDAAGAYKGCLEVSQDATAIRNLQGEKRLLDWK
jgi:DUF438 domain-containing protein